MIYVSFAAITTTYMSCFFILILVALILRSNAITTALGYQLPILLLALVMLRLFLPFSLPFTRTIYFPEDFSKIWYSVRLTRFYINKYPISICTGLVCVWFVGFIVNLILLMRKKRLLQSFLFKYGEDITQKQRYPEILSEICKRHHRRNRFKILAVPNLSSPAIWNYRQPYILLPKGIPLSLQELRLVLYHEAAHYFHYDMLWKNLLNFLSVLYWWNPICPVLKKYVSVILEMQADRTILQNEPEAIAKYQECLLNVLISSHNNTSVPFSPNTPFLGFCSGRTELLKKRFMMMNQPRAKVPLAARNILLAFAVCIFVFFLLFFV